MPSFTVLLNSSVLAMRKSLILASFLFSSALYSSSCDNLVLIGNSGGGSYNYIQNPDGDPTACTSKSHSLSFMPNGSVCNGDSAIYYEIADSVCYGITYYYHADGDFCPSSTTQSGNYCVPNDQTCANGFVFSSSAGGCVPPLPPEYDPDGDPNRELDQLDGDQSGCNNAGGYYFTDGSCNTAGEAIPKVFKDPLATIGAMLTVGGVTFGAGGIVASAAFGATPVGAVTFGALAVGGGLISMATAFGSALAAPAPSQDVTVAENRIKVSLTSSGGSGGTIPGTNLTKTNTQSNKVEQASFIPQVVTAAMADPSNVNTDTGELINPIPTAGMTITTYDYATNTATTEYHLPDSTSSVPHTSTTSTSFTVTQNFDGTVTTVPTNTAVAPTVSGTDGGTVVSAPTAPVSSGSTGSGTTTGDGTDYTGVLNGIKNNTGSSASTLDSILSMFDDTPFDGTMNDGSDSFGDLKSTAEGSFGGFVYTDPLGLNNSASSTIPTYSFTLMGQTFVIFDQELFNKLPVDLIKGILLMVAAIAGLITTISGV